MPEGNDDKKQPWEDLGFDTFDAYAQDQKERLERSQATVEDRKKMIDTQAGEIGTLRGENKSLQDLIDSANKNRNTTQPPQDNKNDINSSDDYDGMNVSQLEDVLSDDEHIEADKVFLSLKDDDRKLIKGSDDAKAEFIRQFLRKQDEAPDSLFGRNRTPRQRQEETLKQKIQGIFKSEKGSAGTPGELEQTGIPGFGKTPDERKAAHEAYTKASRQAPIIEGGDLLGSLKRQTAKASQ